MTKLRSKFCLEGIQFLMLEHPVGQVQVHDVVEYCHFHKLLHEDFSPVMTTTDMINYGFFTDNELQNEVVDNIKEHIMTWYGQHIKDSKNIISDENSLDAFLGNIHPMYMSSKDARFKYINDRLDFNKAYTYYNEGQNYETVYCNAHTRALNFPSFVVFLNMSEIVIRAYNERAVTSDITKLKVAKSDFSEIAGSRILHFPEGSDEGSCYNYFFVYCNLNYAYLDQKFYQTFSAY